ncbi:MAG TPA: hypothetical protein VFI78_00715 [Salinimicrobium sp.]|nr:hypothetical protein [Salinimicrobium sp.]
MTKKEEQPKGNREDKNEREQTPRNMEYNPGITAEDKEVLNNQSEDEGKGNYFKERQEPIDYEGEDLDIPEMDEKQFNETASKPDDSERKERPKESANSNDNIESQTETVYKGEDAKKYRDPSKNRK